MSYKDFEAEGVRTIKSPRGSWPIQNRHAHFWRRVMLAIPFDDGTDNGRFGSVQAYTPFGWVRAHVRAGIDVDSSRGALLGFGETIIGPISTSWNPGGDQNNPMGGSGLRCRGGLDGGGSTGDSGLYFPDAPDGSDLTDALYEFRTKWAGSPTPGETNLNGTTLAFVFTPDQDFNFWRTIFAIHNENGTEPVIQVEHRNQGVHDSGLIEYRFTKRDATTNAVVWQIISDRTFPAYERQVVVATSNRRDEIPLPPPLGFFSDPKMRFYVNGVEVGDTTAFPIDGEWVIPSTGRMAEVGPRVGMRDTVNKQNENAAGFLESLVWSAEYWSPDMVQEYSRDPFDIWTPNSHETTVSFDPTSAILCELDALDRAASLSAASRAVAMPSSARASAVSANDRSCPLPSDSRAKDVDPRDC